MGQIGVRFKLVGKDFFDLYKDESVNYVEKVQDFGKIDNNYGDFSFSFSIPATVHNLGILDFYNDPNVIDTFNPFIKQEIEMYLNQDVYATGQFRLLEFVESNNTVKDIKIQFFAELTNLKEALREQDTGEDVMLSKLGFWQDLSHLLTREDALSYLSGGNITSSTTGDPNVPLKYPILSQDNIFHWQGVNYEGVRRIHLGAPNYSGSDNDIGILNSEIRPAISVVRVIDEIFNKVKEYAPDLGDYEIRFAGESYFDDLYLWLANGNSWENNLSDNYINYQNDVPIEFYNYSYGSLLSVFPKFTNKVQDLEGQFTPYYDYKAAVGGTHQIRLVCYSEVGSVLPGFRFRYIATLSGVVQPVSGWLMSNATYHNLPTLAAGDTINGIEVENTILAIGDNEIVDVITLEIKGDTQLGQEIMNVPRYVPEISCSDFLLGILRTFNAVMYWDKSKKRYVITHKTDWYLEGKEIDLSNAVDITTSSIFPPEFFRVYNMNFQEGEDFRNKNYAASNDVKGWGFANVVTKYLHGSIHTVANPFTASMFQQIVSVDQNGEPFDFNTDIPSFQTVNPVGESVDPGVRLMCFNGLVAAGGTYTTANADDGALPIGQTNFNKFTATSNDNTTFAYRQEYSWEVDGINPPPLLTRNLYSSFFSNWVKGIYDLRTRRYSKSFYLNYQQITDINLNDTIIIGDRKYFINTLSANFLTGLVKLDLMDYIQFPTT